MCVQALFLQQASVCSPCTDLVNTVVSQPLLPSIMSVVGLGQTIEGPSGTSRSSCSTAWTPRSRPLAMSRMRRSSFQAHRWKGTPRRAARRASRRAKTRPRKKVLVQLTPIATRRNLSKCEGGAKNDETCCDSLDDSLRGNLRQLLESGSSPLWRQATLTS